MNERSPTLSRRQLLLGLWLPKSKSQERLPEQPDEPGPRKAIIQGRYCLAYRNLFCANCVEQCPEEGAIVVIDNVPSVNPSACTGCGVCHDVCPAPQNAALLLPDPIFNSDSSNSDSKVKTR